MKTILLLTILVIGIGTLLYVPQSEALSAISYNRAEMYRRYKWSADCEKKYKSDRSGAVNNGLYWNLATSNRYILEVFCQQSEFGMNLYEYIDIFQFKRLGITRYESKPILFWSKIKYKNGDVSSRTRKQVRTNPEYSAVPAFTFKFLEKYDSLGDCGIYDEYLLGGLGSAIGNDTWARVYCNSGVTDVFIA
jgi:hypothetical protein